MLSIGWAFSGGERQVRRAAAIPQGRAVAGGLSVADIVDRRQAARHPPRSRRLLPQWDESMGSGATKKTDEAAEKQQPEATKACFIIMPI